jgi:hypothetical protein
MIVVEIDDVVETIVNFLNNYILDDELHMDDEDKELLSINIKLSDKSEQLMNSIAESNNSASITIRNNLCLLLDKYKTSYIADINKHYSNKNIKNYNNSIKNNE